MNAMMEIASTTWVLCAFLLFGAGFLVKGLRVAWQARQVHVGKAKQVRQLICVGRGFRCFVVGLGLIGFAAGVHFEKQVLIVLAVAIGLEELYEATLLVGLLRYAERLEARHPDPMTFGLG